MHLPELWSSVATSLKAAGFAVLFAMMAWMAEAVPEIALLIAPAVAFVLTFIVQTILFIKYAHRKMDDDDKDDN
jgi:hypothetical protein